MKGHYPYLNTEYARNKTIEQYDREEKGKLTKKSNAKPVKQGENDEDNNRSDK